MTLRGQRNYATCGIANHTVHSQQPTDVKDNGTGPAKTDCRWPGRRDGKLSRLCKRLAVLSFTTKLTFKASRYRLCGSYQGKRFNEVL